MVCLNSRVVKAFSSGKMAGAPPIRNSQDDSMQALAFKIPASRRTALPFTRLETPLMTTTNNPASPLVGVVMGSSSDWDTMQHAVQILEKFGVAHDARVVSAHRMPDDLFAYAEGAAGRGLQAIIAGAGGAAHLPGMLAAKTIVPVLGVPVASKHLQGVDSLHSIVQMPKGIPVATFAIGVAGAANAALFAVAMLALHDKALAEKLQAFRAEQTAAARAMTLPPL
jgi:5-(carboxyamino)imidazole ribonucleotide mutase